MNTLAKTTVGVLAALTVAGTAACSDGGSDQNPPPPPPAAFGTPHDFGNGNSVTVEGPHPATLPGDLKATVVLVKVNNGSDQAVKASDYTVGVDVDHSRTTGALFGLVNLPQGQVQSHSSAEFPVVFEAPRPGQVLDVSVGGPGLGGITYEGTAP